MTDKIQAIKTIQKALDKGMISAQDYHNLCKMVENKNVVKPHFSDSTPNFSNPINKKSPLK